MGVPSGYTSAQVVQAVPVGTGAILQVVNFSTNTQTNSSVTTYADTAITATITPQSASSKVLILVDCAGVYKSSGNVNNGVGLRLLRGATSILQFATSAAYTGTTLANIVSAACCYLDSPATTSATTYKVQIANPQVAAATVSVNQDNPYSTITLLEVSA